MSAPPFFRSAGRGDPLFWGGGKDQQEKKSWRSEKGVEEICSFELSGKEIFSNYDETNLMMIGSREQQKKRQQKEVTSRAERMIQVMVESKATSKWQ